MSTFISPLSQVDPSASIGADVHIGPFCLVGPDVVIGDRCVLDSHVAIIGHTTIGSGNRFFANSVIGGEPQDHAYDGAPTKTVIGDNNVFREGATVHRGAPKEDGTTRIGDGNAFFANSHVAHNCHIFNRVILVNGVLLGGHVHVHDGAIVSGNTVVHHFTTLGTLSFVSGGCRVPRDVPPYMLAAGNDEPKVKTVNLVGMRRAGIGEDAIRVIRKACQLLFRRHLEPAVVRERIAQQVEGTLPPELDTLLHAVESQKLGKLGRAREGVRKDAGDEKSERKEAA